MNEKLWAEVKHFSPKEFDSPDVAGSGVNMNVEFVKMLDKVREVSGVILHVNSGFRSAEHNAKVGGKLNSAHTRGLAADVRADNSTDRFKIICAAAMTGFKRIGIGENFVHLDMDYELPQGVLWLYPAVSKG